MRVQESAPQYAGQPKRLTYKDYLTLPPDDFRHQLIEGEIVMTPAPKVLHQFVVKQLFLALNAFVTAKNLGSVFFAPCDVYFDEHNVVQPDLFFISRDRLSIVAEDVVKGAPDLIMEVLSPASAYYDLVEKKALYARAGVKEYWIVDPKWHWIEVYALDAGAYQLFQRHEKSGVIQSQLLPEFEVELSEVFK